MEPASVVVNDGLSLDEYHTLKLTVARVLKQYQLAHATIEIELEQEFCRDLAEHH